MRNIVVAGSTGLIGRALLQELAKRQDVRVSALVRRPSGLARPPVVREQVFVYSNEQAYAELGTPSLPCDVLLCALGTTQKQAGSKAAFQVVDRDLPLRLASRLAAVNPSAIFGLVSAVGAERPLGFYLQTKAEVEEGLLALGLQQVIVRPSLLLGERPQTRLGEEVAGKVLPALYRLGDGLGLTRVGRASRYRPIAADAVARALIQGTLEHPAKGRVVLEGDALFAAAK